MSSLDQPAASPDEADLVQLEHRRRARHRNIINCLQRSTEAVDTISMMFSGDSNHLRSLFMGHSFSVPTVVAQNAGNTVQLPTVAFTNTIFSWLGSHEEAQVMLASVLVVFGIWWTIRTLVTFVVHILLPLLLALAAVILVPQLREPLLGHNYPVVLSILRTILLKLAETLKTNQ